MSAKELNTLLTLMNQRQTHLTSACKEIAAWIDRQGDVPAAGKIRDSLNHVLLNAIKFTPDEGVITLSGRRGDDSAVELTVRDTGVGIDAANLPRMGERFFTGFDVSRHTSGHFEYNRRGLGLGLSIVRSFVEMHGGTMSVSSELGKGTAVAVRLPAAIHEPRSKNQVEPAPEAAAT